MPRFLCITALLIVVSVVAHADPLPPGPSGGAATPSDSASNTPFDALRRAYVELRRDMMLADGSKIVPGESQVAVYVSVDPHATATLTSVSLEMNGTIVGTAQYSDRQRDALRRGASILSYIGTTLPGTNTLTATISGTRDNAKPFVKTTPLVLPESTAPLFVAIELSHTQTKDTPDVDVRIVTADENMATNTQSCDWLLGCPIAATVAVATELQYRSVLYTTFQEQHELALVESMSLLALSGEDPTARLHLDLAQLNAATALGMHDLVDDTAAKLDAAQAEPRLRIRLGFLHARNCHARQAWPCLKDSLQQFDQARRELQDAAAVPAPIDAEVSFMRAELATADGDFDRAQYIISTELSPKENFRAYALFNLGVRLHAAGVPNRAERVFTYLTSIPVYTDDALDLKTRARIALSAINLQRTQSGSAEATLRDAPAKGRYHEQFMASYGTRAMEHGDYELAARIWLTLVNESPWSSAGKTAQVAYPMCLEHIAPPNVALTQYRDAEVRFEQRLVDLDVLTARTQDRAWNARLLDALAQPAELGASDPTLSEWRARIGHDDWLYWFNADSTQAQLLQLRDLERISASLAEPVPASFTARARDIATNASRLASDRRARLSRSIADMTRYEVDMAQQQLRLIYVGIARTSDHIADRPTSAGTR
jgi:hypothetical protein